LFQIGPIHGDIDCRDIEDCLYGPNTLDRPWSVCCSMVFQSKKVGMIANLTFLQDFKSSKIKLNFGNSHFGYI